MAPCTFIYPELPSEITRSCGSSKSQPRIDISALVRRSFRANRLVISYYHFSGFRAVGCIVASLRRYTRNRYLHLQLTGPLIFHLSPLMDFLFFFGWLVSPQRNNQLLGNFIDWPN
ncbi:hypothetical protein DFP73DRAFT_562203 [Morchella snyderi]|nr:hypothetical protein DFP73DRAFT_562203 [Morchella snyderi]